MSTAPLELFVLPGTIYPRRVLQYLHEKGLIDSPMIKITPVEMSPTGEMTAPGKPQGSVPILRVPSGAYIKQSISIIDYFEDLCDKPVEEWQRQLAAGATRTGMRGETIEMKARIRDIIGLADEASSQFGFACHKGSQLFVGLEETNAVASRLAMEWCIKNLKLAEKYYEQDERLDGETKNWETNIADCVLFALLQFAIVLYGFDLTEKGQLPVLRRFYHMIGARQSAQIDENSWKQVKSLKPHASQWLW